MEGRTGTGEAPNHLQRKLEGIVDDFVICPVRNMTENEDNIIRDYILDLEMDGRVVHYPPRDTNQKDAIGLNICTENKKAIKKAKQVHLYYNPESAGTVFDLGMLVMANKELDMINPEFDLDDKDRIGGLVFDYAYNIRFPCHRNQFYETILKRREEIKRAKLIEYDWYEGNDKNRDFLFDFGMSFMAEKPIMLKNRKEAEKYRTEHKSFQNVLLALHDSLINMPFDEFEKKFGIKKERNDM